MQQVGGRIEQERGIRRQRVHEKGTAGSGRRRIAMGNVFRQQPTRRVGRHLLAGYTHNRSYRPMNRQRDRAWLTCDDIRPGDRQTTQ